MIDVASSKMSTLTSSWAMHESAPIVNSCKSEHLPLARLDLQESQRRSTNSYTGKNRQVRPRNIQLPLGENLFEDAPISTPSLQSHWSRGSFTESILTPIDSPEGMYTNYWGPREGSVVSSTSSSDTKERLSSFSRHTRLERPLVGRPKESRERCMSVSLVVGPDGSAQIKREEVEVEFLDSQKDPSLGSASLMKRMVSNAGSDVSVSRNFNNMSLINSTRGEVLVRSASQQTDLCSSIPLTPSMSDSFKFVSPESLKRNAAGMQRSVSTSMLRTPESNQWQDSDGSDDDETQSLGAQDEDAQAAVQKLFDRKQGKVVQGFVGSTMPTSPLARPRHSKNKLACGACQMIFRSSAALANHTSRCSVKQTPFASADFFETLDMFGMSSDLMLMADFTDNALEKHNSPLILNSLLDPAFCDEAFDDEAMLPRKRSKFDRLPSLSPTPTRTKNVFRANSANHKI